MRFLKLLLLLLIQLMSFGYKDTHESFSIDSNDKKYTLNQFSKVYPAPGDGIWKTYLYIKDNKTNVSKKVVSSTFFGDHPPLAIGFIDNERVIFAQDENNLQLSLFIYDIKKNQKSKIYIDYKLMRNFGVSPDGKMMICNSFNRLDYPNNLPIEYYDLYLIDFEKKKMVFVYNNIINYGAGKLPFVKWSDDSKNISFETSSREKKTVDVQSLIWEQGINIEDTLKIVIKKWEYNTFKGENLDSHEVKKVIP